MDKKVIDALVADSTAGLTLMESETLRDIKPSSEDEQLFQSYVAAHPDRSAYHVLFALRRHAPDAYRSLPGPIKAQILVNALAQLKMLNDWGYLDLSESHDGEAALALLELGTEALKPLIPLLDDARPAPLFGSEEATLSSMYHYRRKDFAYRYIMLILGQKPMFDASPDARDVKFAQLKSSLQTTPSGP